MKYNVLQNQLNPNAFFFFLSKIFSIFNNGIRKNCHTNVYRDSKNLFLWVVLIKPIHDFPSYFLPNH